MPRSSCSSLYSKFCDRHKQTDVFYTCVLSFLIFFVALTFLPFPMGLDAVSAALHGQD
jgi:ATP/ADP translocase